MPILVKAMTKGSLVAIGIQVFSLLFICILFVMPLPFLIINLRGADGTDFLRIPKWPLSLRPHA